MREADDDPLRSLARADNARLRRKVVGWGLVTLAVVGAAAFLLVRAVNRTINREAVPSSYLEAVQQGRFAAAYDLLCSDLQGRLSRAAFASAPSHEALAGVMLDGVGLATAVGDQRGAYRFVSYSYPVTGTGVPVGTRISVLTKSTGETKTCIEGLESRNAAPPTHR